MSDQRSLVLAAASQASEATAELVRRARDEGDPNVEVIELLADAVKIAIEADADNLTPERNQLLGALERFLEGWA